METIRPSQIPEQIEEEYNFPNFARVITELSLVAPAVAGIILREPKVLTFGIITTLVALGIQKNQKQIDIFLNRWESDNIHYVE